MEKTRGQRVVIVGASGRSWDERSELLMRQEVSWIIYKYIMDAHTEQIDPPIVISGHCPIGRERWYCVECQTWFDKMVNGVFDFKTMAIHAHHKAIKVFDLGGVDTWAEIIGNTYNLGVAPFPARPPYPQGFFIRNMAMVKAGDVVHCIEPQFNPNIHKSEKSLVLEDGRAIYRSGGYWTYNEALKAGKQGFLTVI